MTESPGTTSRANIAQLVSPIDTPEYLDACSIIAAFNFINRIALPLGVRQDVPRVFRGRRRQLARILRTGGLVRFDRHELPNCRPAAESLSGLTHLFRTHNLGRLPSFFTRLGAAPYLLHVQLGLLAASLKTLNGRVRGAVLRAAEEFCTASGASELAHCLEYWRVQGESPATDPRGAPILAFALRINRQAHTLREQDVDGLRRHLSDEEILDLVFGVAVWNGLAQIERLASPLAGRSLEMQGLTTSGGAKR
jgi:alkylhydroperoxidase family enzyme